MKYKALKKCKRKFLSRPKAKNEIKNRKHFEFILRGGKTEREPKFGGKIKENGKN